MRKILELKLGQLEETAYNLADQKFRLHSSDDICRILYRDLKMPLNGEKDCKTSSAILCSRNKKIGHRNAFSPSASKEILLKLTSYHKLPSIIIEWRKINSAITNTIVPLARSSRLYPFLKMKRICPTSNMFTATGRMTMQEPSIQMVPRDFEVNISSSLVEGVSSKCPNVYANNEDCSSRTILMSSFASLLDENEGTKLKTSTLLPII